MMRVYGACCSLPEWLEKVTDCPSRQLGALALESE